MPARKAYGTAIIKKATGKILDVELASNREEARRQVRDGNRLVEESNAMPGLELPYRWAVVTIQEDT